MFNKRFTAEKSAIATGWVKLSQIFDKIGRDTATEFEIRRAARELNVDIDGFGAWCEEDGDGFKLKRGICE